MIQHLLTHILLITFKHTRAGPNWLTKQILRIKMKGNGTRKPSSPETEPNFYVTRYLPLKEENDESKKSSPSKNGSMSPSNTVLNMDNNDSIPFHNGGELSSYAVRPGITLRQQERK
jgi:hypothetical protein